MTYNGFIYIVHPIPTGKRGFGREMGIGNRWFRREMGIGNRWFRRETDTLEGIFSTKWMWMESLEGKRTTSRVSINAVCTTLHNFFMISSNLSVSPLQRFFPYLFPVLFAAEGGKISNFIYQINALFIWEEN